MPPNPIAIFGEVLLDQFPDGQQILGGAPFNVAWHLQAFGQHPCFISRIGADAEGLRIRTAMQAWDMDTDGLQTDDDYPTGTVAVRFVAHPGGDGHEPHYDILKQQAYDFIAPTDHHPAPQYGLVYHGTLALREPPSAQGKPTSAQTLQALLAHHTGKVFVDVNLRAPWWQAEHVKAWLTAADWVKLNAEELLQLARPQASFKATLQAFLDDHQLTGLVVTQGAQGAAALTADGEFIEATPPAPGHIADTVGAGDAFASVLLLGLHHGWPLAMTLARAQTFASALLGQTGATVQDRAFYRPFIGQWQLSSA